MAPEEFAATIALVNRLLEKDLPRDFGWCLFGYACCACTAGLALGPGLYLRRQVRARISLIDCHAYTHPKRPLAGAFADGQGATSHPGQRERARLPQGTFAECADTGHACAPTTCLPCLP